jgi:hypothetical protein
MLSLEQRVESLLELARKVNIEDFTAEDADQHYQMSFGGSKTMYKFYTIRYTIQENLSSAQNSSSPYIKRWAQLLQSNSSL